MTLSQYKKYTPLIVLLILLTAIGCIVWLGILPLKESINGRMRNIQEFYADRENRDKQIGKLPELKRQYEAVMEDEKTLNILITEGAVVDFVKILEQLASETNVAMSISSKDNGKIIESKKPEVKTDQSRLGEAGKTNDTNRTSDSEKDNVSVKVPSILDMAPFDRYLFLNVKAEGQYADIVKFLSKLESLPFGLDVIKVEIKKKDTENNSSPAKRGDITNPFSILGDGSNATPKEPLPVEKKDAIEAMFDIIVYVKKN
jgi:hypothetical protein